MATAASQSQSIGEQDDSVIRIKAGRVAKLMDMVGELGLAAEEVIHHPEISQYELDEFQNSAHKLNQLIRELQDIASGLRLVPIDGVFRRMQRLIRDLSKQTKKNIKFIIEGEETEIDKVVVDLLSDPLVHMIRNSVDHGIEEPDERLEAGKTEKGTVKLSAKQEGGEIQITIEDDGRGLNKEKIFARAVEKNLIKPNAQLTEEEIYTLIFEPGFSTKEAVSQLSGRGVGMDVVKTTITSLRGRIEVESRPGNGSTMRLIIPLSLAFLDTMVVMISNKLYAISIDSILEVFQLDEEQICSSSFDEKDSIKIREEFIPVRSLDSIYGRKCTYNLSESVVLILNTHQGPLAIPVDQIFGQYQVTVKPLTGHLKNIRAVSGCALLPNGDVAMVLDCQQLKIDKQ